MDAWMRHLEFPPDVLAKIQHDRYYHPDPLVQRRMEILGLKALGQRHDLVAKIALVSRITVQRVLRAYRNGGLEAVQSFHWKTRASALTTHQPVLEAELTAQPPHTVQEACERIEKLTGVRRRPTQIRKFLRESMGLRWRKTAAIPLPPKKTREEHAADQAAFLKDGTAAASGRGSGRATRGLLCRCGPLRAQFIPGLDVVQMPAVCEGSLRTSALQRIGSDQRGDAATGLRDQ
jgi:transposase